MQQFLRPAETQGVQKSCETFGRDGTSLSPFIERNGDVLSEVGEAMEWIDSQEGEKRANVFKPVLNRCTSQAPS